MRLADFIRAELSPIRQDWEDLAKSIRSPDHVDKAMYVAKRSSIWAFSGLPCSTWRGWVCALPGSFATPGRPLAYIANRDLREAARAPEIIAEACVIGE